MCTLWTTAAGYLFRLLEDDLLDMGTSIWLYLVGMKLDDSCQPAVEHDFVQTLSTMVPDITSVEAFAVRTVLALPSPY